MRKRSSYRPRPVLRNPVGFVVENLKPLSALDDDLIKMKLRNHEALRALQAGSGTAVDVDYMVGAVNVADALRQLFGRGEQFTDDLLAGQNAVLTMARRGVTSGRFLFTGPELTAVNLALEIHDAQLDITTLGELDTAVKFVQKLQKSGKAQRIRKEETV